MSIYQKTVILKARAFLQETIKNLSSTRSTVPSNCCFNVVNLGCSSGTLYSLGHIRNHCIIHGICLYMFRKSQNFRCFSEISLEMTSTPFSNLFLLSSISGASKVPGFFYTGFSQARLFILYILFTIFADSLRLIRLLIRNCT